MERMKTNADTVVVFDVETAGMSPDQGDRAIETGRVSFMRVCRVTIDTIVSGTTGFSG
jgi:DNA polymerase III epsilon subunit-like protein